MSAHAVNVRKRNETGRDLWLTLRMLIVAAALLLAYAALVALCVEAVAHDWNHDPRVLALPLALAAIAVLHFRTADRLLLSAARARPIDRAERPELHAIVDRLAIAADLPTPRVAIAPMKAPNSFAVGFRRDWRTIVVGEDLLGALTSSELEAVIAHELSHFANGDAVVLTAASFYRTDDLRRFGAVHPFLLLPLVAKRWAWLDDHPPLARRIARLERMSRAGRE